LETEQFEELKHSLKDRSLAIFFGVSGVVLAVFIVFLFVKLWPIAMLLMISLMLVAALSPIVSHIKSRFNRKTATTVVVVSLLVGIVAAIALTIPAVASQLTTLASNFDNLFKELQAQASKSSPELAKLLGQIKVAAMPSNTAPQAVKEVVLSVFTMITSFVTVLMLTAYLVVEGPSVATALVSVFPRKNRLQVRQMFGEIGDQIGSYIRGQMITSFMAGAATFIVLTAFSVPNALALALLMAIADAIPIVGPILGIVPAAVSAYSVNHQSAIYVLIVLVIYHQIENYLIVPFIYGRALRLSPLAVLLSVLVGASLLGIVGAFIALPFAAAMPILLRHFNHWRNRDSDSPNLPSDDVVAA
jgi:predicted PurR-regulated permease PerM